MRCSTRNLLRCAAAIALVAALATPEPTWATEAPVGTTRSLDSMSPAELDHFVQQLNESANWRKYRRPGDPPDFVPGKPVRVMNGAGAAFGRGGRGGGARSFRRSGLASRRGTGSRRGPGDQTTGMDRGRGSRGSSSSGSSSFGSSSGFGSSSRSRSSSGSSRSSFGSSSGFGSSNGSGSGSGFNFDQ